MNLWKVLGLAGLAGVGAAGVIIAREQRQRSQLAPEEIRARLRERLELAPTAPASGTVPEVPVGPTTQQRWLLPWLPRRHRRHAPPGYRSASGEG
ncbi:MAG: hypothetical protein ABI899_12045 [Actinomycetota bacterium]